MNKSQKMNRGIRRTRWANFKYALKRIITFPWRLLCAVWNWLKSIDIVGMINLTLLVVIIVLFSSLIVDLVRFRKCASVNSSQSGGNVVVLDESAPITNKSKIANHGFDKTSPVRLYKKTNGTNKSETQFDIKSQNLEKTSATTTDKLPQQVLSGDTIVDVNPVSPVLSDGAEVNGNLIIQNLRKYTLPCDMKVNGHLFIRNVARLHFCGSFTVNGNIYVDSRSVFGPLPEGTKINGQIIM